VCWGKGGGGKKWFGPPRGGGGGVVANTSPVVLISNGEVGAYIRAGLKWHAHRITSFVLYGYETWSLTLREERRPRMFGNMVLRRI